MEKAIIPLPQEIEAVKELATMVAKSQLFEETAEQLAVKIMLGRALQLEPMQAVLGIDVIPAKDGTKQIFVKPKLLASRIKQSGKYDYRVVKSTKEECIIDFFEFRDGRWEQIGTSAFTLQDARQQGLLNSASGKVKHNWATVPQEMLFYRAMSRGVSLFCPDVLLGMPLYLSGVEEWKERAEGSIEVKAVKVEDVKEYSQEVAVPEREQYTQVEEKPEKEKVEWEWLRHEIFGGITKETPMKNDEAIAFFKLIEKVFPGVLSSYVWEKVFGVSGLKEVSKEKATAFARWIEWNRETQEYNEEKVETIIELLEAEVENGNE
jgi:hypothetical protein